MSLYQYLFSRLLATGDRSQHRIYGDRKRALFADLTGTVVEIGPGTGVNLPYYPRDIEWIGLEPNPHMHDYLRERAAESGITAEIRAATASNTGLPDASADAVVSTLVLCSVPDLDAALAEIKRILKPDGRFYFMEHVAAPADSWLRTIQRGIKPVWRPLADGCHPDRETEAAIERAGFRILEREAFRAEVPVVSPHIIGVAALAESAASADGSASTQNAPRREQA
jgi:ubiquinone/menaquinone biosynthesis C-methylase UbiE